MRFVTYETTGGSRVGVLSEDGSVQDVGFDGDMLSFITAGAPVERQARVPAPVRLRAPINPVSLRDFLAFESHLQNAFIRLGRPIPQEWFEVPAYYKGMPQTIIGPDDEIPWPAYTSKLDYELELAAVIGEGGIDIPESSALAHVFGFTIWNDMSARDVQARELPIGMGPGKAKDWDGSNILGPCIVTSDELDLDATRMEVRVNGELRGQDHTSSMYHPFESLIAYASQAQALYPGEVFGSGTAGGGSGFEVDSWLEPGDLIELTVEGIGTLRNRVGARVGGV